MIMNATTVETVTLIFEMTPCGRCGGTGQHLYNQRDGRVCWGCSGAGEHLSPRGKRAAEALDVAMRESAGTVAVADITPGMRIKCPAHGGLDGQARPWNYKPAWRTVASVEITEYTGRGQEGGYIIDVPCVRASLVFEDGKTWTAESSDHPAYWAKGAFRTTYSERSFWLGGEEARAARMEVRRAIARRFVGAWLEGEEPPARPERKPRTPKPAQEAPAPKPLASNRFAGDCRKCGTRVEAEQGERERVDGRWEVQHKAGECQERPAAEEAQEAPQGAAAPAQERPARPAMVNKFPGKCARCGVRVLAEQGERVRVDGEWITRHREGECPASTTTMITEEGMYAREGEVYRVRRSESGNLYAERLTPPAHADGGATFTYDPAAVYALTPADRMTVEAAAEVGRRLHACCVCGQRLTDPASVKRGIGPVCRKRV
jgi:hypothetical protein